MCAIVRNGEIILYSVQSPLAVKKLERTGQLYGSKAHSTTEYLEAYSWLAKEMRKRLPPVDRKVSVPLWAWYCWEGDFKNPCDLRRSCLVPRGTNAFRIKFRKPRNEVLLSDFDGWHSVLNKGFHSYILKELDAFDNLKVSPAKRKTLMEKSWMKIFDLNSTSKRDAVDSIQATFWNIKSNEVLDITEFKGR
jgi:hypothetical protein